jgi:vancomycin resistance protein VanW
MTGVAQPINRSSLRLKLAREYYILRRCFNNMQSKTNWSKQTDENIVQHQVFSHKSLILRPLKDVEMYLQENKRTNLEIAIRHLNNTIIKPGQTFSFWHQVGRPTKAKGYLEGLVLKQGKIEKGTGGGLCQLGNLLFWIAAHSPLTICERHRHSFDVFPDVNRNVPFGAGATLSYNYIDLRIKNETQNTFQLKLWLDDEYLNGELLSSEKIKSEFRVEERNHIIKQQIWGGYTRHNQIFRIETCEIGEINESLLAENHAIMMYAPFLEG